MCQAIPRRVLQVADQRAEVLYDGTPIWVAVHGIPNVEVGQYLVVYAGQALERLPVEDAEEMLRFYAGLERMVEEAVE
ncbi:MAG TPA: HypC/HybG/HupF family hydrogenase formation chaperone [Thermomicrobiales bacterium]|nr:HypC/HybG/HupF family hydrogenase formation chaperone [Thermomicrobiales bacterium]